MLVGVCGIGNDGTAVLQVQTLNQSQRSRICFVVRQSGVCVRPVRLAEVDVRCLIGGYRGLPLAVATDFVFGGCSAGASVDECRQCSSNLGQIGVCGNQCLVANTSFGEDE